MVYEKKVKNGEVPGKEWLLQDGSVYSRIRMLPNGNIIYKIFVVGGKELLESDNANKFFESFRLHAAAATPVYLESKAKLLLHDLQSEDSATRVEAFSALYTAPFSKEELPLLHDALLKSYRTPYEFANTNSINQALPGRRLPSDIMKKERSCI